MHGTKHTNCVGGLTEGRRLTHSARCIGVLCGILLMNVSFNSRCESTVVAQYC